MVNFLLKFILLVCLFEGNFATVGLGTCSLSCGENKNMLESTFGDRQSIPARPGKRGPPGEKGEVGIQGQKGDPGRTGRCECSDIENLADKVQELEETIGNLKRLSFSRDCAQLKDVVKTSGTAVIFPFHAKSMGIHVYCEQEVDGGGWIVIQRRQDGTEDFYRGWEDYVNGFGDKGSEFWLGLEVMHQLTGNGSYELRVDLEDFQGNKVYAKYRTFSVAGATDNYRLTVTGYSGTAGDAMDFHNGFQFSTKEYDRDVSEDEHCATKYKSGWWYNHCHHAHPNGIYKGANAQGVAWYEWKGNHNNVGKRVDMKIRKKS